MSFPATLLADLPVGPPSVLQLFQYGLPVLLGYVLYVGIAGRFTPGRPAAPIERPTWFLGLWTALSVAAVTGAAMHFAYGLPLDRARELFTTAAWSLAAALVPGYMAWFAWRSAVRRTPADEASFDAPALAAGASIDDVAGLDATAFDPPIVDATATGTFDGQTDIDAVLPNAAGAADEEIVDGVDLDAVSREAFEEEALDAQDPAKGHGSVLPAPIAPDDAAARRELEDERRLREQTEKHLQVTRRALYSLDAAAREGEHERADTLIALETELEAHVRRSSAAESRATREECGRVQAETHASELKAEVLRLRSELRRAAEARARAVGTAGKSVAFARRALQARTSLESRLRETEEALANRQETISSLIRTLETEKGRTQELVSSRAKQLVLHERQLRERRSLEEVARSVEGKLSTRLVKKVARARPLAGG